MHLEMSLVPDRMKVDFFGSVSGFLQIVFYFFIREKKNRR